MPRCHIQGCANNSKSAYDNVKLFCVPTERVNGEKKRNCLLGKRRVAWLTAIAQNELTAKKDVRLCGNHFVSGKPAELSAEGDVDWIPTLNLRFGQHGTGAVVHTNVANEVQFEPDVIELSHVELQDLLGAVLITNAIIPAADSAFHSCATSAFVMQATKYFLEEKTYVCSEHFTGDGAGTRPSTVAGGKKGSCFVSDIESNASTSRQSFPDTIVLNSTASNASETNRDETVASTSASFNSSAVVNEIQCDTVTMDVPNVHIPHTELVQLFSANDIRDMFQQKLSITHEIWPATDSSNVSCVSNVFRYNDTNYICLDHFSTDVDALASTSARSPPATPVNDPVDDFYATDGEVLSSNAMLLSSHAERVASTAASSSLDSAVPVHLPSLDNATDSDQSLLLPSASHVPLNLADRHHRKKQHTRQNQNARKQVSSRSSAAVCLDTTTVPTPDELREFERNPDAALMSLVTNSGLARFSAVSGLYGRSADIDNSLPNVHDAINQLLADIETNVTRSDLGRVVLDFQNSFHIAAPLYSCASCGVRAFQMGLNASAYREVDLRQLAKLRLTTEQLNKLETVRIPYREVISHFKSMDTFTYHLHREFVTVDKDMLTGFVVVEKAMMCSSCANNCCNLDTAMPKNSIAAGVDYGVPERIGLQPLHLAEQYLIARARLYVSIVKLTGNLSLERQSAKYGHVITFPQPEAADLAAEQLRFAAESDGDSYPRIHDLKRVISVAFVGAQLQWEALVPTRLAFVNELRVRSNVVFEWLRALKELHPYYTNIAIDDSPTMEESLASIAEEFVVNATVISGERDIAIERIGSGDKIDDSVADAAAEPEAVLNIETTVGHGHLPMAFITRSNPTSNQGNDTHQASRSVLESLVYTMDKDVSQTAQLDPLPEETARATRVNVPVSRTPINEFQSNAKLLYCAFPFLFPLGAGLEKEGSVPSNAVRHMLLQFTGNFGRTPRFIFCLFDQLQRHAASRTIAARIKNDPASLKAFTAMVADPTIIAKLKEAAKNPGAKESIALLNKIMPHVKTYSSVIPFTVAQRKASMHQLYAMVYHFGMPSVFFTFAPDEVNGPLNIRFALRSSGNTSFPALDGGLIEALQQKLSEHHNIGLSQNSLRILSVTNPVAVAQVFKLMTEAVFENLFGIKSDKSSKFSVPLGARKPGVLGKMVAAFAVIEEQQRGTPHLHLVGWGGLPPMLLQSAASVPKLVEAVSRQLDMVVSAQLRPETHVDQMLKQLERVASVRSAYFVTHNPLEDKQCFDLDVERAAGTTNIHRHSSTCHKGTRGVTACRLSRPQPLNIATGFVRLEPIVDVNDSYCYNVHADTIPPLSASLPGRNISAVPVAVRDRNLIYWDIERPPIDLCDPSTTTLADTSGAITENDVMVNAEWNTPALAERLANLTLKQRQRLIKALPTRNGLVVEYNPVVSALLGCNTNFVILGSDAQAKAILCYLLKYITKPSAEIAHSLSLLHNARQTVDSFPSVAANTGEDLRTAAHFLNRVVNKLSSSVEISATVASAALLGMNAEISTHGFHHVFVDAAMQYALHHPNQLVNGPDEFDDLDCDFDENELMEERADPVREDERRRRMHVAEEEMLESDQVEMAFETDDAEPENANPSDISTPNSDGDTYAAATVYTGKTGKVAVPQHIHYAYRGYALRHFSLYEYAASVNIRPVSVRNSALGEAVPSTSVAHDVNNEPPGDHAPGRPVNGCFFFAEEHPLYLTHFQQLLSKTKVPKPVKNPPAHPEPKPKPEDRDKKWEGIARHFAAYYLTLFRPWTHANGTLPGLLSWLELSEFMRCLQFGSNGVEATTLDIVRRRWIENMAQGLRVKTEDKIVTQMFRSRAATVWGKYDGSESMVADEPQEPEPDAAVVAAAEFNIDLLRQLTAEDLLEERRDAKELEYHQNTLDSLNRVAARLRCVGSQDTISVPAAASLLNIYQSDAPDVEILLSKLKEDVEDSTDESNNPELVDPIADDHIPTESPPPETVDNPDNLNAEQLRIFKLCSENFRAVVEFKSGASSRPEPVRIFVHGGPGTGKTHLANCIKREASKFGLAIACMAPTGIAASCLPDGRTIHNYCGFKPRDSENVFYDPLNNQKKICLQKRMKKDTIVLVIVDELSCIHAGMFGQIEKRISDIMDTESEHPLQFGGLSVLVMGDVFQLPPVIPPIPIGVSIFRQQVSELNLDLSGVVNGPRSHGALCFSKFRKIELVQQMRAAEDVRHSKMLQQMRYPIGDELRIPIEIIAGLKTLTADDVEKDPTWLEGPVAVTSNNERHSINSALAKAYAKLHGKPFFTWKLPLEGTHGNAMSQANKDYIYKTFPQFTGIFVAGAPGFLTSNINPSRRLANSTPIRYHSLLLDPQLEDVDRIQQLLTQEDVTEIELRSPPQYIMVSVTGECINDFRHLSMRPDEVVIPISRDSKPSTFSVQLPGIRHKIELQVRVHGVDLGYSVTDYKVQGKTLNKIIVDLNYKPFSPQLSFHGLYVILSRVRNSENIRVLPMQPGSKGLHHLRRLQPPPQLLFWLAGFEPDTGNGSRWCVERARTAFERHNSATNLATSTAMPPPAKTPRKRRVEHQQVPIPDASAMEQGLSMPKRTRKSTK